MSVIRLSELPLVAPATYFFADATDRSVAGARALTHTQLLVWINRLSARTKVKIHARQQQQQASIVLAYAELDRSVRSVYALQQANPLACFYLRHPGPGMGPTVRWATEELTLLGIKHQFFCLA